MKELGPITLAEILAARERLAGTVPTVPTVQRTPLVRLHLDGAPAEIHLKLENLQPIGSFKLRGAGNALLAMDRAELAGGVYTPSAGNMAQGVAWMARRLGVRCRAVVPDHAPRAKTDAIERLGGEIVRVPFDTWWRVLVEHRCSGLEGAFVHPVADARVIAGNGTIGLEILEDLPDVDAVVIPFGGGGLTAGIATALRAKKPSVRIFAAEVETAAPLDASLRAGRPEAAAWRASFVDGIGGKSLLAEMWPLVSRLVDGSIVVSLEEIAEAIRLLVGRARVVAEGAGAASTAAALTGKAGSGKVVCVVSGGNIDPQKLSTLLAGGMP